MRKYHPIESNKDHPIIWRTQFTTYPICLLFLLIFTFDVLTPADHISVSFAYSLPVLLSLLERTPRPILYASVASVLSVLGSFIQPPADMNLIVLMANRLLAVLMQWMVATLVVLQHRRLLEAREKAETQRRFVDILSHEIGTALTTVTGQAFRLTKMTGPLAPDDIRTRADKLRKAAERIRAIISRIQIASSFGDGSIPAGSDPIDIQIIISQLAEQMKEEYGTGPIEIQLLPGQPLVLGDETMIRHVFENVILNGIKYSPPGSPIKISVADGGAVVVVSVSDRGSGISRDELPRIRIPYYRGQNSVGISGVGLGLYVVERVVEAHGGRIAIESELNAGTTLLIELPKAAAQ